MSSDEKKCPYRDLERLSEWHVATLDQDGNMEIHCRPGECPLLNSREFVALTGLGLRAKPWLLEKSGGRPAAQEIHVWDPDDAITHFFCGIDLERSGTWGNIQENPGQLFILPDTDRMESNYGGLTADGKEFVIVPCEWIYARDAEEIVRMSFEHFSQVDFKSKHEKLFYIAGLIEDKSWSAPNQLTEDVQKAARDASYWRTLAGSEPLQYDSRDIRQKGTEE